MRYHDRCRQHKSFENRTQAEYNKFRTDTHAHQIAMLSQEQGRERFWSWVISTK